MPTIISAKKARKLFATEKFPREGYYVVEMQRRPYAKVIKLEEYMKKIKRKKN